MIGGEGTSPRRWMTKIWAAMAVARIAGGTRFTVTAVMGPVEAKRRTSAQTVAVQYSAGEEAVNTRTAKGTAARVATPLTQRWALRFRARSRSPSQPPARVPAKPVTTRMSPGIEEAWAWGTPRTLSKKEGSHAAIPPRAKV